MATADAGVDQVVIHIIINAIVCTKAVILATEQPHGNTRGTAGISHVVTDLDVVRPRSLSINGYCPVPCDCEISGDGTKRKILFNSGVRWPDVCSAFM